MNLKGGSHQWQSGKVRRPDQSDRRFSPTARVIAKDEGRRRKKLSPSQSLLSFFAWMMIHLAAETSMERHYSSEEHFYAPISVYSSAYNEKETGFFSSDSFSFFTHDICCCRETRKVKVSLCNSRCKEIKSNIVPTMLTCFPGIINSLRYFFPPKPKCPSPSISALWGHKERTSISMAPVLCVFFPLMSLWK